jgi:hypothetical protein
MANGIKVGSLFVEVGGDISPLAKSFAEARDQAKNTFATVEKAGERFLLAAEKALNPTKELTEKIKLLTGAGKSNSDIQIVLGDSIRRTTEQAIKNGQAIDPLVKKHYDQITALDKSNTSFGGLIGRLGDFGKAMLGAGAAMLTANIGYKLLSIGKESVQMAMDAVESENLFSVSMGKMAESARKWSKETSEALGLNEFEIRKNVGTFNVMFNSMKLGEDASYDMAKGLTQLAYDFSSFYNLKPEEAFEKLRAGITGEAEPLKRLGILVDETTTKTYAYTHGIAKQGEELTQQQKTLARYGSILEQTSAAQGDMARTADSPANAVRRLGAQVDELQTKLAMTLLPAMSAIVGSFNDAAGSVDVADSALVKLSKSISFPLMAFYKLNSVIADLKLSYVDLGDSIYKLLGDKIGFAAVGVSVQELAKNKRDAAAASLEWNKKIQDLEDSVNNLGKAQGDSAKVLRTNYNPAAEDSVLVTKKQIAEMEKLGERIKKMEWSVEKDRIEANAEKRREAAKAAEWMNSALIEQSGLFNKNSGAIDMASLSLDGYIKKYPGWADAQGSIHEGFADTNSLLLNGGEILLDYGTKADKSSKQATSAFSGMGNEISTVLTNLSQELADKVTKWAGPFQTFASKALASLVEGLFSPVTQYLNKLGKELGDWMTGLLGGKSDGFQMPSWGGGGSGGSSGGSGGGAAGLGGAGKYVGAGLEGVAGVSSIIAGLRQGGWSGAAGVIGGGAMTGAAIGSVVPGIGTAVGALVGAIWSSVGLGIGNLVSGPNSYEALAKEVKRDLGISISHQEVKAFMDSMGISESKAWDHRVEIEQSPMFMAYLMAMGEKPETKWEAMDYGLDMAKSTGHWGPYNDIYGNWVGNELKLSESLIPWRNMLIAGASYPDGYTTNLPAYSQGTPYVPEDGLAYLHKGEAVIPANQNKGGRVIQILGNIYGFDDFVQKVREAEMQLDTVGAYA